MGPPSKHDGVEDLVEGSLPDHLELSLTQLIDAVYVWLLPCVQLDGFDTCQAKKQVLGLGTLILILLLRCGGGGGGRGGGPPCSTDVRAAFHIGQSAWVDAKLAGRTGHLP